MKTRLLSLGFLFSILLSSAQTLFNKAYHERDETANSYLVEINGDLYFTSQKYDAYNFGVCFLYKHTSLGQLKFKSNILGENIVNIGFKTNDHKLVFAGSASICDVSFPMQTNFISKLDTNGTAIFTSTYSAFNSDGPKAVLQVSDSSYCSFTDSILFKHSKSGLFLSKLNLGLTNISSALLLQNGNILLSALQAGNPSLIQISNTGTIINSKTFPLLLSKLNFYESQKIMALGTDKKLYKISPNMDLIGQSNFTGNATVNDFSYYQDTLFSISSAPNNDSQVLVCDTLFNIYSLTSTTTHSLSQNAIHVSLDHLTILATGIAGNGISMSYWKQHFVSLSKLSKGSSHNFQYDLTLLSIQQDSAYNTSYSVPIFPNSVVATSYLRVKVKVKNSGLSTIHHFLLNSYELQSGTCGSYYFQEEFSNLNLVPGDSISLICIGFAKKYLDIISSGSSVPVNYCFYTSLPNGETDKTVEDNEACKSFTFLVTSLKENVLEQYASVSPNPFNYELNIETNAELKSIKVYNTLGQVILTQETSGKKHLMTTSDLQHGIYFLHIETEKGTVVKKVLKN